MRIDIGTKKRCTKIVTSIWRNASTFLLIVFNILYFSFQIILDLVIRMESEADD